MQVENFSLSREAMMRVFCPACGTPAHWRFRIEPCCHWMCAGCARSVTTNKECLICRDSAEHVSVLPALPCDDPPRTTGPFGATREEFICPICQDRVFLSLEAMQIHWDRAHQSLHGKFNVDGDFHLDTSALDVIASKLTQ